MSDFRRRRVGPCLFYARSDEACIYLHLTQFPDKPMLHDDKRPGWGSYCSLIFLPTLVTFACLSHVAEKTGQWEQNDDLRTWSS
jgi:hypothetical protein